MLSHEEMVGLQAEKHDLIDTEEFGSKEEYLLHLIHSFDYVQIAKLAKGKAILDLGCNTGYGSEILSHAAAKVVGIDVSENALELAKRRYGHRPIDFQLTDGKKLPFQDGEFDMIVSCQVIEHVVDYDVYISELKRVLAAGGMVFFTTPNSLLRLDPGMTPWNPFHVREFDAPSLKDLLGSYFSDVHIAGLFAKEPLYSIEVDRVGRARDEARKEAARSFPYKLGRAAFRKVLPKFLSSKKEDSGAKTQVDPSFVEQYSTNDLFYQSTELPKALDLLGICTDDPEVMKWIQAELGV